MVIHMNSCMTTFQRKAIYKSYLEGKKKLSETPYEVLRTRLSS